MTPLILQTCSWKDKSGSTLILIKVKPGSKVNKIIGLVDVNTQYPVKKALSISIAAAPEDNKANKELLRFLSRELGIKKDKIFLEHGDKNKIKVLSLGRTI